MDFPFHGIPTVPPRKDMMHLVSGKKRERERKNREKERQREREQRTTHSKREGGKKRFLLPDFLLPGLPLSRHRRALVDLRGCQARPLGRRDLEVQQGGRQGEHARDEEVGGLGAKEREKDRRKKPPLFSTLSDDEKKRKNPNPKSCKKNSLSPLLQTLIYAGQILENDRTPDSYGVPRVRGREEEEREREQAKKRPAPLFETARSLSPSPRSITNKKKNLPLVTRAARPSWRSRRPGSATLRTRTLLIGIESLSFERGSERREKEERKKIGKKRKTLAPSTNPLETFFGFFFLLF